MRIKLFYPLTNVKWHSDPWPTVTSLPIRLSTNFMTFIPSLTFTELWVVSHGAFATGVASQQGTLTLPDTWFRPPFWDLLMLQLLRPNSSNLPCLYSTFHLEYPLVLSRFYFVSRRHIFVILQNFSPLFWRKPTCPVHLYCTSYNTSNIDGMWPSGIGVELFRSMHTEFLLFGFDTGMRFSFSFIICASLWNAFCFNIIIQTF